MVVDRENLPDHDKGEIWNKSGKTISTQDNGKNRKRLKEICFG